MNFKDIDIIPEEKNNNLLVQECNGTEMVSSTSKNSKWQLSKPPLSIHPSDFKCSLPVDTYNKKLNKCVHQWLSFWV